MNQFLNPDDGKIVDFTADNANTNSQITSKTDINDTKFFEMMVPLKYQRDFGRRNAFN